MVLGIDRRPVLRENSVSSLLCAENASKCPEQSVFLLALPSESSAILFGAVDSAYDSPFA